MKNAVDFPYGHEVLRRFIFPHGADCTSARLAFSPWQGSVHEDLSAGLLRYQCLLVFSG